MTAGYRPDIDGLRAVAVLAVVAYHAFPKSLPGGFAGVDVFFVISGFLITSLLLKDLAAGTYSLAGFYARRIRRIFPALALVLAACLAVAWLALLPKEFVQFGKHAAAAAGFVANFSFWSESGYFEGPAARKPLLHLWSLGVEEQYYIVWPLLLAVLWRRPRLMPWLIAALAVASFAANIHLTNTDPVAAFFFPQGRLWELLLGGMVAIAWHGRLPAAHADAAPTRWTALAAHPAARECASALGLAAIGASFFLLNRGSYFPGWWALLPTIGTALVALAGPGAWLNRVLLAQPVLVAVGLISYPLYLWHWPMLSFVNIVSPDIWYSDLRALKLTAVLIAFLLAVLTYRFVELPIRQRRGRPGARAAGALCAGMAALGLLGLVAWSERLPPRLNAVEARQIDAALGNWDFPIRVENRDHRRTGYQTASIPSSAGAKTLFVGDSHVAQYWSKAAHVVAGNRGAATPVFAVGCPPLPSVKRREPGGACMGFFEFALGLAKSPDVRTIVFSARWQGFLPTGPVVDEGARGLLARSDGGALTQQDAHRIWDTFAAAVRDLVASGKRVYLIAPHPESVHFDPRRMIRRFALSPPFVEQRNVPRDDLFRAVAATTDRLRRIADSTGAVLIDPFDYLCEAGVCRAADEHGRPLYIDTDHLRPFWSIERAVYIEEMLGLPRREGKNPR